MCFHDFLLSLSTASLFLLLYSGLIISGTALLWFQSYLSSRYFSVKATVCNPPPTVLWCPSRLSPRSIPFHYVYQTIKPSRSILLCSTSSDVIELFISFTPSSFSTSIAQLLNVVNLISKWMPYNTTCIYNVP